MTRPLFFQHTTKKVSPKNGSMTFSVYNFGSLSKPLDENRAPKSRRNRRGPRVGQKLSKFSTLRGFPTRGSGMEAWFYNSIRSNEATFSRPSYGPHGSYVLPEHYRPCRDAAWNGQDYLHAQLRAPENTTQFIMEDMELREKEYGQSSSSEEESDGWDEFQMELDLAKLDEIEKMPREKVNYSMLSTEKQNRDLSDHVQSLQDENSRLRQLLNIHGIHASPRRQPTPPVAVISPFNVSTRHHQNSVCSNNSDSDMSFISEISDSSLSLPQSPENPVNEPVDESTPLHDDCTRSPLVC